MKESEHAMKQATAKIGQIFNTVLPGNWTDFVLHMFVPAKASEEFFLLYSTNGGRVWHNLMQEAFEDDELLMTVLDGQDAAKELHKLCAFEDDNWTEMTYTMKRGGQFHCDFDYKRMDFVSMEQRKAWHSRANEG